MLGKLSWEVIPTSEPIIMVVLGFVMLGAIAVLGVITYFGKWGWLWKNWVTTTDHKRIGIMYCIVAILMLVRGFADAIMMRTQQAMAYAPAGAADPGYLTQHHYDQVFTAHGVIMIFFMAMALMTGLMNLIVPLQIGARDVAFPFLNSLSFWLLCSGVVLIMLSMFVGDFGTTGWLAYPPQSGPEYSPGVGVDYYLWSLQLSGLGTLLTGVNFLVTIIKCRTPSMKLMQMPVFTWTVLITCMMIVATFPMLTVSLLMLSLDRYLGMHFFTNGGGGDPMLYVNLIWTWGHPEVYILVLPAFGMFSEIVAVFARKAIFGYKTMVWATAAIAILSSIVWVHHFFTMGAGANVNTFFGIMTMVIAVPTGVKMFNWLFTMYRGRIRFEVPMLWVVGFLVTFALGGMTGVLMAVPPADFLVHNSLFLVAHFHNTIIGGVVFGYLAGMVYWFPKAFGFKMNDKWGRRSFWCWLIGFYVAFMPLYVLGFMGMTRRLYRYDNPYWQLPLIIACVGVALIALGIFSVVMAMVIGFLERNKTRDLTGDPWENGRTLEWATSSPPPVYNFAVLPEVHGLDAFWTAKEEGKAHEFKEHYEPILMPRNTASGFFVGLVFATALGFGLTWHIWWLALAGFAGMIIAYLVRTFNTNTEYYIPGEEVKRVEKAFAEQLSLAGKLKA